MYEATTILKLSNAIVLNSFMRIENRTEPAVTKKMLYYVSSTEEFTTGHSQERKSLCFMSYSMELVNYLCMLHVGTGMIW